MAISEREAGQIEAANAGGRTPVVFVHGLWLLAGGRQSWGDLFEGAETRVDTANPDRGPLLIFTGEKDHAVPPSMSNAAFKKQKRNPGVTELAEMPGRGHSLTIDSGWREVADRSLEFIKRFV